MFNVNRLNPFAPTVLATTEIAQLRVYPIKSCRGIVVNSSTLTKQGLDLDRNWMFVKAETRKFITIRDISELTLVDTALATSTDGEELLVISIRGHPDQKVQIPARPTKEWLEENTTLRGVHIWSHDTDGYVYGEEINKIFSKFLGYPVELVYKGPTARIAGSNAAKKYLGREQSINFPDVMPLQIANEASLHELNQRLKDKDANEITIEHFRPNIIVRGGDSDGMPAWSEDSWKTVRIVNEAPSSGWAASFGPSTLDIDVQARCGRCQVPNVNPESAVKDKHQPWDVLMSYRRVDPGLKYKPCFGMLSVPRNEGPIKVGMKFEVIETTDNHVFAPPF